MKSCCACGADLLVGGAGRFCPACLFSTALDPESTAPGDEHSIDTSALFTRASALGVKFHYLGDYELIEEIGRGGMGVVYSARQTSLGRTVALKMILSGHLASEESIRRFQGEASAAARLDHPHIISIYEVGEHQGLHYFSMKLVRGGSLANAMSRGPMASRNAALLMLKVADAVAHAHAHGVLHRDLKPGNILLDSNGEPSVADFGLAKLIGESTGNTRSVGTPAYVAPEQLGCDGGATVAADIYSLGVILYEMLAGRLPFPSSRSLADTLRRPAEPPRLVKAVAGVDRDLEAICFKCLEADPRERYQSASALAEDLQSWVDGRPISARHRTALQRTVRLARAHPATSFLLFLCLCLAVSLPWSLHKIGTVEAEKTDFVRSVREEITRDLNSLRTEWAKFDVPYVAISSDKRREIWKAGFDRPVPEGPRERFTFGIYAHESPVETAGKFAPFLALLEDRISRARSNDVRIDLRIYKDNRVARQALVHGAVDVVRLGAGPFVLALAEAAERGESLEVLARTTPGQYDAVLFARADTDIRDITALRGRSLALGDLESTISGLHIPALLAQAGLTGDDLRVCFHNSHTAAMNRVLRREYEAGVAKVPLFQKHQHRSPGLVALTNVTCLSMPWVARSGLPATVVDTFRRCLLNLPQSRSLDLLPDSPTGFEPATAAEYLALSDHRARAARFLGGTNPTLELEKPAPETAAEELR